MDDRTREAIQAFQLEHADEIRQIVADASGVPYDHASTTRGGSTIGQARMSTAAESPLSMSSDGELQASGELRVNDATHQAIANAWPRQFFGHELSETQAFDWKVAEMARQGTPYEEDSVNVVGVRGFQGGQAHDNRPDEHFTKNNRYDDTLFVLVREGKVGRVRGFRATVDPGGSSATRSAQDNPGHFQVQAGQQWNDALSMSTEGTKLQRPQLAPQMIVDGEPDLVDGDDSTREDAIAYLRARNNPIDEPESSFSSEDGRHGAARVMGIEGRERVQSRYFAMHSGSTGRATGDKVGGDSTGCQVVLGGWYGPYIETIRRSMQLPCDEEEPPTEGIVRYSLIDGAQLGAPGC